jgi:Tfp pilus assembly protein PilF
MYRYHLGTAYAKTNQVAKARRTLEDALRLQPDFSGSADARKLLTQMISTADARR